MMMTRYLAIISIFGVIICCVKPAVANRDTYLLVKISGGSGGSEPEPPEPPRPPPRPIQYNYHQYCSDKKNGHTFNCADDCNHCHECRCKNKRIVGAGCTKKGCPRVTEVIDMKDDASMRSFCFNHPIGFNKFKCKDDCNTCFGCLCERDGSIKAACTKRGCF